MPHYFANICAYIHIYGGREPFGDKTVFTEEKQNDFSLLTGYHELCIDNLKSNGEDEKTVLSCRLRTKEYSAFSSLQ